MNLDALLQQLQHKGISLSLDDEGGLKVRAAKGVVDDALLAQLKQHKTALLQRLRQTTQSVIPHQRERQQVLATPQQQRLWLACQAQGEQLVYHMPAAVLLQGKLDTQRLQQACQQLMQQQPLLRAAFSEQLGQLQLQLQNECALPFTEEQAHLDASQVDALLRHYHSWFEQPFDLSQAPLWRIKLVHLAGEDSYLLLLNIHHLITDAWSNRLLLQQLMQLYQGQSITTEAINYLDYADWLQQQEATEQQQKLNFWRNSLSDCQSLNLSGRQSVPDSPERAGSARCPITALTITPSHLHKRAKKKSVSVFALYHAALVLLLHKLSGRKHFAIASPSANRGQPALTNCVGYLVNTLSLPCQVKPGASLASLVQRCHRDNQLAQQYGDVPFADILDSLGLYQQKDVSRLLEAGIQYQPADISLASQVQQQGELQLQILEEPVINARFPLTLVIAEDDDASTLYFEYQTDYFDHSFVEQLADLYPRCLQAIVEHPQQHVTAFNLLDDNQQLTLLGLREPEPEYPDAWQAIYQTNQTCEDYQAPVYVQQLIEAQVEKTPQAIAVSDETQQLSYQQLDQQANQLAHYLQQRCGSDQVIALCQPRSVQLSVALLAILKSGNAYLPLDTDLPASRKAFILDDAGVGLLLGKDDQSGNLPCLDLLRDQHLWQGFPVTPPLLSGQHQPLFNRIYTSGSSGEPKGVNVPHSGIVNRLLWMQQAYPINSDDVVLQKTPVNFDVSVWELFWPLLSGARLHFARPEGHKDTAYLYQLIEQQQITTLHFVPSMFNLFLQQGEHARCQSLQRVFCSGEALALKAVKDFVQRYPACELHNLYGPTEASVDVSYFDCRQPCGASVPIGKPIANTQLHILDKQLRPLPPGCLGEIYIGGAGLAQGYHQRDKLNSKRFIDNPWYLSGHPSPRLYRTGDLGRYLADGNIAYHGRKDNQIKLRGVRIELGDIEERALQHPLLQEAIALLYETDDDQQLMLFYTASQHLSEPELREFLAAWLSVNMLPNRLLQLSAIPLTHNGKADRQALLAEADKVSVVPLQRTQNAIQARVLDIWQRYLHKPIELDANFFELGGHSLMASRIIADLSQTFQIQIGFADMLSHASVMRMASLIEQRQHASAAPLIKADRTQPLPLSAQQQQLLLFQRLSPHSSAYHMPALFDLRGELHLPALDQAFKQLIARHEILHSCYEAEHQRVLSDDEWQQRWQLEYQAEPQTEQRELQALAFQQQAFDLQHQLPLRVRVLAHSETHHSLIFCLHHIAGDATSLQILARDLAHFYSVALQRHAPALPTLHYQYADYACWQHQQDNQSAMAFWLKQLNGVPERLNLPHDKPRQPLQRYQGQQQVYHFSEALSGALQDFCAHQQLTPFVVLLSSYQLLLARLSQQSDICVAVPVDGRQRYELADVAGNMVNTLAMRMQLQANADVSSWLQQQQAGITACMDQQHLPIETLLQALAEQEHFSRHTDYTPVLQAAFNYLQLESEQQLLGQWPGLQVEPISQALGSTKTDISWQCYQHGNSLQLVVEFNTDLFLPSTIACWINCYEHLLQQILQQPQQGIQTLTLFPDTELPQRLRLQGGEQAYPLTAMQRDIYLDSLINPDNRQNYIGFVTHSEQFVDAGLWQQSLQQLYRHCDSLRACIRQTHDALMEFAYQVVLDKTVPMPACCFSFTPLLQAYSPALKQQLLEQVVYQHYQAEEPLWRVRLYRFADNQHLLILGVHHAMFDGVSMQMLGRLMKGNYEKLLQQQPIDLPANNFADYVLQNRQQIDRQTAWDFWQQQTLATPLDLAPLCTQANAGLKDLYHSFSAESWQQLRAFCKQQRTTPAIYMKALFALTASYQHDAQQDYLFGDVVSGRSKAYITTLGLFFEQQPNLLPARVRQPDNTLADVLRWFAKQRKQLVEVTPLSLMTQRKLFPDQRIPYLFNFYIMESETGFQGEAESIEHIMPQMDHAVNFICKVIDDQLTLQLSFNNSELPGENFLQQLLQLHQQFMAGDLQLPDAATMAQRLGVDTDLRQPATAFTADLPPTEPVPVTATALQQALLDIWQQVLGRTDIGLDDNFFELGGHSLTAMAVANRVQESLQLQLPLQAIFAQPTIRFIAQQLLENPRPLLHQLPPLQAAPAAADYPLSFAQQRLWLLMQMDASSSAYNMPLALKIEGKLDTSALQQALYWLVDKHQNLRTRLLQTDSGPRLTIAPAESIRLQQRTLSDNELSDELGHWQQQAFAWQQAPLCRVALWQLHSGKQLLLFCLHHIIADGRSLQLIAADLLQAYEAATRDMDNPLASYAGLQYQDYAVWQQSLLAHDVLQQQCEYWQKTLADAPLLTGLPYDYPRPQQLQHEGAQLGFTIHAEMADQLRQLANTQGISLFMLMLAAYQLLLARHASQRDICIGIPRDARLHPLLENVSGFFVNALVIRSDLHVNYSMQELLTHVREQCLQAFANELVPVEQVMKALALPHQLDVMPLVQAAFNWVNGSTLPQTESVQLGDLHLKPLLFETQSAKFELLLSLVNSEAGQPLQASFEYNSQLLRGETVQRLADDFCALLSLLVEQADTLQSFCVAQWLNEDSSQTALDRPSALSYWRELSADVVPLAFQGVLGRSQGIAGQQKMVEPPLQQAIEHFCDEVSLDPEIIWLSAFSVLVDYCCQPDGDFVLQQDDQWLVVRQVDLQCDFSTLCNQLSTQIQTSAQHLLSRRMSQRLLATEDGGLQIQFIQQNQQEEHGENAETSRVPHALQLQRIDALLALSYSPQQFSGAGFLPQLLMLMQQLLAHPKRELARSCHCLLGSRLPYLQNRSALDETPFYPQICTQQQREPERCAVICGEKQLSYGELEKQVQQFSRQLQAAGIEPGDRVAIALPKHIALLPVLLGCVHLGACYVMLETAQPQRRLQQQLESAAVSLLVCDGERVQQLAAQVICPILNIDNLPTLPEQPAIVAHHWQSEQPFYLMFTSGSSGMPKAVQVNYRSFNRLLNWYTRTFAFTENDRTLLISSNAFDLTQKNFFAMLMCGGTLVLDDNNYYEPQALAAQIVQHGISCINAAPSACYPLLQNQPMAMAQLRLLLLGGEEPDSQQLQQWQQATAARTELVNMYGPSECTDISSYYQIKAHELSRPIPLGQPLPDCRLYLLNAKLQPVADGLYGELYISGPSLSAGYWQQPALNQQAFIENPFADATTASGHALLYKTGDRAVFHERANGERQLYYVGRSDAQIKRHGVRLHPAEIEQALLQLPEVTAAKALMLDEQLHGFVIAEQCPKAWYNTLQQQLPIYAIPQQLHCLPQWPLTANGKLDQVALAAIAEQAQHKPAPQAAENAHQQQLLALWQQVLGREQIGIHDNFFELGGDSIKAVTLLHKVEQQLGIRVPLAQLFQAQTIADQAELIQQTQQPWSPLVALQASGDRQPVFLVHALGGTAFPYIQLAENMAQASANQQPVYALQAYGLEPDQQPFTDLDAMLECYIEAIKQQQPQGPYQLAGHSFGGVLALELARRLQAQGDVVGYLGLLDSHQPNSYLTTRLSEADLLKLLIEQNFGKLNIGYKSLLKLPQEQMLKKLNDKLGERVDAGFIQRALQMVKGLQQMMQGYQPEAMALPLQLIRAADELKGLKGLAGKAYYRNQQVTLGWQAITDELEVVTVEGDHFSMLTSKQLADVMLDGLAE